MRHRLTPAQRAAEAEVRRCARALASAPRGRKQFWAFMLRQARTAALKLEPRAA